MIKKIPVDYAFGYFGQALPESLISLALDEGEDENEVLSFYCKDRRYARRECFNAHPCQPL